MKWLCLTGLASVGLTMIAACAGNNAQSPAAPTTSTVASVTSVTVTSLSLSSSTYQLMANARLSDGTARDVTSSSQWSSSSALAVVTSTGLLTAVGTGDVVASAMYQSVLGTLKLTVTQPPVPQKFALLGVVHEVAPNSHTLSNARVAITSGPDAGVVVMTDEAGFFRFTLAPGLIDMRVTKDGYDAWVLSNLTVNRDRTSDIFLYPLPPINSAGALATARCADGTWSWSVIRAQACSASAGGIAYGVCPGPLCDGF